MTCAVYTNDVTTNMTCAVYTNDVTTHMTCSVFATRSVYTYGKTRYNNTKYIVIYTNTTTLVELKSICVVKKEYAYDL